MPTTLPAFSAIGSSRRAWKAVNPLVQLLRPVSPLAWFPIWLVVFRNAPNPNAARLFQSFCFSPQAQQLCIDVAGLRSLHPQVKEKPGRRPFGEIKKMKDDPASVEKNSEQIKARYSKLFGV